MAQDDAQDDSQAQERCYACSATDRLIRAPRGVFCGSCAIDFASCPDCGRFLPSDFPKLHEEQACACLSHPIHDLPAEEEMSEETQAWGENPIERTPDSRLHRAHRALALLGSSTHHIGRAKRARQELERFIAEACNEPIDQVRDWAARQYARVITVGEEAVLADIDRAFEVQRVTTICEGRR